MDDTIAALATPFGEGAIAILRLSGPRAVEIAEGIFRAKRAVRSLPPRQQQYGAVFDGTLRLDDVLLTVFPAPASYTGEDVVEIAGHGGVLVARRILELLLRRGARPAHPGEFTQRAFLHGKMDLTQAEAVMDLITAQSDLALKAATEQLEGQLGAHIRRVAEALLELLAHVEACIDFPDEDIDPDTSEALLTKLAAVTAALDSLLATAARGQVLREGVRTVIYGAPNVGKSSLLNLLLGTDRAIVSPRPGTTRDVLEEVINLGGLPLRLVDTAGIRESADELECAGMERTRRQVARADLILEVADISGPATVSAFASAPHAAASGVPAPHVLRVLNKADLGEHASWREMPGVRVSCVRGEGIEDLAGAITALVHGGDLVHRDWAIAINARHADCLRRALGYVSAAERGLRDQISPEFVAEELRAALEAVGEVVGRVESDDVLGKIFSTFCIGK